VEIRKLTDDGIGGEEMQRVQRLVRNAHLFSLETNAGRASTIGYSQVVLGNARLLDGYEEKIRSVERRQVEGFIGRYLREKDASFHVTRRASGQ
jgi:predicted Zn-dependent peptidase